MYECALTFNERRAGIVFARVVLQLYHCDLQKAETLSRSHRMCRTRLPKSFQNLGSPPPSLRPSQLLPRAQPHGSCRHSFAEFPCPIVLVLGLTMAAWYMRHELRRPAPRSRPKLLSEECLVLFCTTKAPCIGCHVPASKVDELPRGFHGAGGCGALRAIFNCHRRSPGQCDCGPAHVSGGHGLRGAAEFATTGCTRSQHRHFQCEGSPAICPPLCFIGVPGNTELTKFVTTR